MLVATHAPIFFVRCLLKYGFSNYQRLFLTVNIACLCCLSLLFFFLLAIFQPPVSVPLGNISINPPQEQVTEDVPAAQPIARAMPNIMHNATPECLFSASQPAHGHFDVQVCCTGGIAEL